VAELQNYIRKERVTYIAYHVYADLEYILEKTETEETSNNKYQYHRETIGKNLTALRTVTCMKTRSR